MKKVLFTATVDSHIIQFHLPFLKYFKEHGYEVHVATNGVEEIPYCDKKIVIPFERSPFKLNNLKAIKKLRQVIQNEHYDIIHTHTPMGSVVTRLAAKKARKNGTRVIYTAHGFHFFKGAPLLNWCLFYPVEKYLSKYTDTLILINQEDYQRAKRKFKKCRDIEYVPGVGIDEEKFHFKMNEKEKLELRESLGLKKNDFVMIYPAELNKNKNQILLIDIMEKLVNHYPDIKLLLPGKDSYQGFYQNLVRERKLEGSIFFLGYRKDIPKLLKISDLAVASSHREGLPVNVMEAMYSGLPVIATRCRGQKDLVDDGKNGYINDYDIDDFVEKILELYNNKEKYKKFSRNAKEKSKDFTLDTILPKMDEIYHKKKRVLHLLASNKFSGAENVACTIIENLSDEYEMYYCSPSGSIEKQLQEKNISYIPIDKLIVHNLKKIQKIYKIDIIHAHDIRASVIAGFCSKYSKIISHVHGNHLYMRSISLQSVLFLAVSKSFSKIFWVSPSSYENYCFKKQISKKSMVLINVIDSKEVKNKVKDDHSEYFYDIIFLGRLNEAKNPMRMIKIFHRAIQENKDIKCAIVGDGEFYDDVQSYIKTNHLENHIIMYGFQNNPYKILSSSKIMLMTSIHEGVPMVALEAMSLGIPIISTPTDGMVNILDETSGFLLDDDEAIVKKILELLNYSDAQMNILKKNIIRRFDNINDVGNYLKVIQSVYEEE